MIRIKNQKIKIAGKSKKYKRKVSMYSVINNLMDRKSVLYKSICQMSKIIIISEKLKKNMKTLHFDTEKNIQSFFKDSSTHRRMRNSQVCNGKPHFAKVTLSNH